MTTINSKNQRQRLDIPEAKCSVCGIVCYSFILKEQGKHYCTECGGLLVLTGKTLDYCKRDLKRLRGEIERLCKKYLS